MALLAMAALLPGALAQAPSVAPRCQAQSGPLRTPVIELYTSEGCSSCPPADQWLSGLKATAAKGQVVAQAFHVAYWDYIGWVDRFAQPAHTARQRQLAAANRLTGIYTPQLLRDERDWRGWGGSQGSGASPVNSAQAALATISIGQTGPDRFEASVTPTQGQRWSAYWSVTEHGHVSRVLAGENNGELLKHDFVVRQYTPVGSYSGAAKLSLRTVAADPKHPRQVNLVVLDAVTGQAMQALSLACPSQ